MTINKTHVYLTMLVAILISVLYFSSDKPEVKVPVVQVEVEVEEQYDVEEVTPKVIEPIIVPKRTQVSRDTLKGSSTKIGRIGNVGGNVDMRRDNSVDNRVERDTTVESQSAYTSSNTGLGLNEVSSIVDSRIGNSESLLTQRIKRSNDYFSSSIDKVSETMMTNIADKNEFLRKKVETKDELITDLITNNKIDIGNRIKLIGETVLNNNDDLRSSDDKIKRDIKETKFLIEQNTTVLTNLVDDKVSSVISDINKTNLSILNKINNDKLSIELDLNTTNIKIDLESKLTDANFKLTNQNIKQTKEILSTDIRHAMKEINATEKALSNSIKVTESKLASSIKVTNDELERSNNELQNRIDSAKEAMLLLDTKIKTTIDLLSFKTDKALEDIQSSTNDSLERVIDKFDQYATTNELYLLESDIDNRFRSIETKPRVGAIFWYYGDECPNKSVSLDGSQISDDSPLYGLFDDTGRVPDYRDRFLRVRKGALGELQDDSTAINGLRILDAPSNETTMSFGSVSVYDEGSYKDDALTLDGSITKFSDYSNGHNHALEGDDETRPMNVGLTLCIEG